MQTQKETSAGRERPPSFKNALFGDVRAREIPGGVGRDLKSLYEFYLSEEEKTRLSDTGRIRRFFKMLAGILRNLLLRLSPVRRVLLVTAIICFLLGRVSIGLVGDAHVGANLRPWGFLLIVFVLMLELKDKLLVRDEIEVARQVQLALLPTRYPRIDGWAIWGHTRPANDVGGDLVDHVGLNGRAHAVALGDVAGKGLGAALLMAKLQATFRALAPGCESLADLGARLNAILHRDGLDNRFATFVCARLEPGAPRIRYLNAGHNPPFVARADRIDALPPSGRPLGMLAGTTYNEGSVDMEPGDLLLAYSDGLVEARGALEEEFGVDRIRRLLPELRDVTVESAGRRILEEVERHIAGRRPHDDLSIILIQHLGAA